LSPKFRKNPSNTSPAWATAISKDEYYFKQDILNNPDMLIAWDVVIFSPAVSVGVSFDIPNHINQVFGVFPKQESESQLIASGLSALTKK
jgi:hypothetical protein